MFKLCGPNKTCPWARPGRQLPCVRPLERLFSRKASWKAQSKHPAPRPLPLEVSSALSSAPLALGAVYSLDGSGKGGWHEGPPQRDRAAGATGSQPQAWAPQVGHQRHSHPLPGPGLTQAAEGQCWATPGSPHTPQHSGLTLSHNNARFIGW